MQSSVLSATDNSKIAQIDIDFTFDQEPVQVYQQDTTQSIEEEKASVATENVENISKELLCTRVDVRIKVPPHSNPEEKTVQVLKKFLLKLQSFDPKAWIAPW